MGKKTVIRIVKEATSSENMLDTLADLLGVAREDVLLEEAVPSIDLEQSYLRRKESLRDAFLLIQKSLPRKSKTSEEIELYLKWCWDTYVFPKDASIKDCQTKLSSYTASLVSALIDMGFVENHKKEAIELLNKAEQYQIMFNGRPDLATLSLLDETDGQKLVLQVDKQLPPCSDDMLEELRAIKRNVGVFTPDWFKDLPAHQQIYFHASEDHHDSIARLKTDIGQLLTKWYEQLIINSAELPKELENIKKGLEPADWFKSLSYPHQALIRELTYKCLSSPELITIEIRALEEVLSQLNDKMLNDLKRLRPLPFWYVSLPASEQRLLSHGLVEAEDVSEAVSFLPSRLRTLPALANFAEHRLYVLSNTGEVLESFDPCLRFSHIASRDVKNQAHAVRDLHTERNFTRVVEFAHKDILLLQTLISPIKGLGSLIPDQYLDEHRQKVILQMKEKGGKTLYSTNHPFNVAKYWLYTGSGDHDCNALLRGARERLQPDYIRQQIQGLGLEVEEAQLLAATAISYVEQILAMPDPRSFVFNEHALSSNAKPFIQKLCDLTQLVRSYSELLNSGYGTASLWDYHGRELWLSSLENLLTIYSGGARAGSCVSGKDRKALELMHTDAILLYRHKYGQWPSYRDSDIERDNFTEQVANLYRTRHAHVHAGQNAPGADGIKTPANYFPFDIAFKVCRKVGDLNELIKTDILATNNEVDRIGDTKSRIKAHYYIGILAAIKLRPESQIRLLEQLKLITNEINTWARQKTSIVSLFRISSPAGVGDIRKLLDESSTATEAIAEVYNIIKNRPSTDKKWINTRADMTQKFYDCVTELCEAEEPESVFANIMDRLGAIKVDSFEQNVASATI